MVAAINLADNVDAAAIPAIHEVLMRGVHPKIRWPLPRGASLDQWGRPRSGRARRASVLRGIGCPHSGEYNDER
jgi:hypothetical protein